MSNPVPKDALLADWRRQNSDENECNRLATAYLVEATGFEHHALWLDHSEEALSHGWGDKRIPRVPWEQITLGYHETIGHFGKMPVHVSISFARVKEEIVAFYEPTSQVVDYRMVEKWLKDAFPASRGRTSAFNFHICLGALGGSR